MSRVTRVHVDAVAAPGGHRAVIDLQPAAPPDAAAGVAFVADNGDTLIAYLSPGELETLRDHLTKIVGR